MEFSAQQISDYLKGNVIGNPDVKVSGFSTIENGEAVLQPANPAYPVLRPGDRLQIFGVVVGLIRNYRR